MFDLEDSVALREKDTARRMVYHALQHPLYRNIETIVRVNALDCKSGVNDLEAVVRGGADLASAENRYRSGCSGYRKRDPAYRKSLWSSNPAAPVCWRRC